MTIIGVCDCCKEELSQDGVRVVIATSGGPTLCDRCVDRYAECVADVRLQRTDEAPARLVTRRNARKDLQ